VTDWILPADCINEPQARSIQRLVRMAKRAHMLDIKVRINGEDVWFEGDWIKWLQAREALGEGKP
jgi:hypothetical protein